MEDKYRKLQSRLRSLEGIAVAYSGGVDSTFLLQVASDLLADRALAVTVVSPALPAGEMEAVVEFTRGRRIGHQVIELDQFAVEGFADNRVDRCYLCKRAYYPRILALARERGIATVADGSNADDEADFRPGMRALKELGVISPLQEAGLTKAEIRELSRAMKLPTWDKPDEACLATRIPYGEQITRSKLKRVDRAEQFLRGLGFRQVRVRCHGEMARIEIDPEERARFDKRLMDKVHDGLRTLGFTYVTLDLKGYRTGSLNENLERYT
ncbi:MAG: ATP-dependent sacrificial sulfur transferase LarE [Syntrophomonadaceae bacterium]